MIPTGLELTWLYAQAGSTKRKHFVCWSCVWGTIKLHRLGLHGWLLATLLHFSRHLPHTTFRSVVDHCKLALHTTDRLLWRVLGFATWLKTIQSVYMPGQPTSCQPPQRTLNRRCSVQTSSTNSAKVLACPRKTHAELFSHPHRHFHICRCADGLVVRRLCRRHFGRHPMKQISWLTWVQSTKTPI